MPVMVRAREFREVAFVLKLAVSVKVTLRAPRKTALTWLQGIQHITGDTVIVSVMIELDSAKDENDVNSYFTFFSLR